MFSLYSTGQMKWTDIQEYVFSSLEGADPSDDTGTLRNANIR